jgi:superfamily II DNA or RNA helicase
MSDPLTQYQKDFLAQKLRRGMLVWSTGTFKTRTSIEWAKIFGGTTLVICPKGLKENWKRELKKWNAGYVDIVSKEEFKNKEHGFYNNLIIDEADHFFGMKSMLSKTLLLYLKKHNPNLLMLTATPLRGTPWNIYRAAQFLGKNWSYPMFQAKFFTPIWMGPRQVWVPKKDDATKELMRQTIASIGDVVRREDHFDIPEQGYETVYVDEDAMQRKMKRESQAVVAIARFTDDHRAEAMNQNKLDLVERMVDEENEENGTGVMVVCRYHEQIDAYREHLLKAGWDPLEVSGRVAAKQRQAAVDYVNANGGVLLVQSSTVEGYELPNVRLMIFASLDYSYRNRVQAEGRNLRMNAIAKNAYVTLIAGDADESVWAAIQNKEDFDPVRYKVKPL